MMWQGPRLRRQPDTIIGHERVVEFGESPLVPDRIAAPGGRKSDRPDGGQSVLERSLAAAAAAAMVALVAAGPALAGKAVLNLVLVLDGLRPDSITAEETPHLQKTAHKEEKFIT